MNNGTISLGKIAAKLGIEGQISLLSIAEKIGYDKRPIKMSDLDKAVEKYLKKEDKN